MNYENDLALLEKLIGRQCSRTVACNSLKLRFEAEPGEQQEHYIWIDPDWAFFQDDRIITTAEDSPWHEDKDYKETFDRWCNLLDPIDGLVLTKVSFTDGRGLILRFSNNYIIYAPIQAVSDINEDDYIHWYAV